MDFKTAFLNGEITDEVFITAPDGYPEESGKVLKRLYGLNQSPRVWYQKLKGWLDENEWTVSSWDSSVWYLGIEIIEAPLFSTADFHKARRA
jgi:hypothetical protein